MASKKEIDAAFAIAASEARWSINKLPTVIRMLEAAERARAEQSELEDTRRVGSAVCA